MVSPIESWSQPRSISRRQTSTTWATGTGPSHGSPKHIDTYARTHSPSARDRSTTGRNISTDSATVRLRFLRAKVSVALPNTATAPTPAARARSRPRSLGTSTGRRGPSPSSPSRPSSSSASASWGTQRGSTNDVVSTVDRPAADSRRTNSALTAAGTTVDSFCRPSRGPTS